MEQEPLGPCQWCGEPAYTHFFVNGHRVKRQRILALVCPVHAEQFVAAGGETEDSLAAKQAGRR